MAKLQLARGEIHHLDIDGMAPDEAMAKRLPVTHHIHCEIGSTKAEFSGPGSIHVHESDSITAVGTESSDGVFYIGPYKNHTSGELVEAKSSSFYLAGSILLLGPFVLYSFVGPALFLFLPWGLWFLWQGHEREILNQMLDDALKVRV